MLATGVTLVLSRECAGLELRPVSVCLRKRGGVCLLCVWVSVSACVCGCVKPAGINTSTEQPLSVKSIRTTKTGALGERVCHFTPFRGQMVLIVAPPPQSVATHPTGWCGCGRGTVGASTDMPRHEKHHQTHVFYLLLFWIILLHFLPCFYLCTFIK